MTGMGATAADASGVLVTCAACGQRNRHGYSNLNRSIRCGRCKTALPPPGEPIAIASASVFDAMIRSAALPVLVDYWAAWCGPCRMVAPEVEKLAASHAGRLVVAKVDTEQLPEVAARQRVQSLPTLAVYVAGREGGRTVGAQPAQAIAEFVRAHAGA
jgi:thioredoxin 2